MDNVVILRDHGNLSTPLTGGDPMQQPDIVVSAHLRHLELEGHPATTVYARGRALARLRAALQVPLLEATGEQLAGWRESLTVSPDTVGDYVSHARQFYAWAAAAGLIEGNPASRLPVPPGSRRLPRPIADSDLFAAIAGARPRLRPMLVLAGWCGLRAKEIALLRRECVLETARPPVLLIAHDATKGRRERVVPLCDFALDALCQAGLPASGWVFRRLDGGRGPNSPARVSQMCNAYLHSMGITATLHQCRHRFGTETHRVRRDLRMVQELMGHERPESTAGYVLVDQADAASVVARLPVPGRLHVVGE
jgi:integrase/recombinase XerC